MMRTPIWKGFVTGLLAAILAGCASVSGDLISAPAVSLNDVKVEALGLKTQTFMLVFDVDNPNPISLPVKNVVYALKLDGERFASGETVSDFSVPANGGTQFAVSVDLDLLTTAPKLLSIVGQGIRSEVPYELEGRFSVDIPFAPPLKYENAGVIRLTADYD